VGYTLILIVDSYLKKKNKQESIKDSDAKEDNIIEDD
jgi:hypothetical protein